ncbi:Curculin domain protein (mannose-binding) lectin [Acidimicrobium ferrooxidans DSM 10331]|uniref:Curculin domain protein (Mannose-binding) lectin n=2 Tax=Acidimicrobium ferrooxidans TaxID=53635 RepID=C7LYR2_ACIFD|nr:Curculin domain protein (mannose-binding) lectin [Acidimicrobium ferrooxidans DSM 10331]
MGCGAACPSCGLFLPLVHAGRGAHGTGGLVAGGPARVLDDREVVDAVCGGAGLPTTLGAPAAPALGGVALWLGGHEIVVEGVRRPSYGVDDAAGSAVVTASAPPRRSWTPVEGYFTVTLQPTQGHHRRPAQLPPLPDDNRRDNNLSSFRPGREAEAILRSGASAKVVRLEGSRGSSLRVSSEGSRDMHPSKQMTFLRKELALGTILTSALAFLLFSPLGTTSVAASKTAVAPMPAPSGDPSQPAGICCSTQNLGSTIGEGTVLNPGDYLLSSSGQYQLIMQGDGNFVLYNLYNGQALWATGTEEHSGAYAVFQNDGNLVVYFNGTALWDSHTYTYSGLTLTMQNDGNAVIYQGTQPLWATDTAANELDCWPSNNCTPGLFIYAYLQFPPTAPLQGVNAPTTGANTFAMSKWEQQEDSVIQSNPLDTTQKEPGSYTLKGNSANVQVYTNSDGESADYWGIDAFDQTISYLPYYGPIISVLRNPVNSPYQQCVNLANAVSSTLWGTINFSDLC